MPINPLYGNTLPQAPGSRLADSLKMADPTTPMPMESAMVPAPPASPGPGAGQVPTLKDYLHQHLMALPVNAEGGKRQYKQEFIHSYLENASRTWADLYGQQIARQAPQNPMQAAQTRYYNAQAAGQETQNELDPNEMNPLQQAQIQTQKALTRQHNAEADAAIAGKPAKPIDWDAVEADHQTGVQSDINNEMKMPGFQAVGTRVPGTVYGTNKAPESEELKQKQAYLDQKRPQFSLQRRKTFLEHSPWGQMLPLLDRQAPQTLRSLAGVITTNPMMKRYLSELADQMDRQAVTK